MTSPGPDFLPRLWATRKVGFLLGQIRQHGEETELADEIVHLSRRYGIITPYTSFLILEDEPSVPLAEDSGLRAESGADAVAASEEVSSYAGAGTTTKVRSHQVRYVGEKTFFLRDGFWRDASFDEDAPAQTIQYGSEAYFGLVTAKPELGRYLAVGRNVLFATGGQQYRVGENEIETRVNEGVQSPVSTVARLEQNFPNPFNSSAVLRYRVATPAVVRLDIYDAAAQRVRSLVDGFVLPEVHQVSWDGLDDEGMGVASGTYVARLSSATGLSDGGTTAFSVDRNTHRKLLLVK